MPQGHSMTDKYEKPPLTVIREKMPPTIVIGDQLYSEEPPLIAVSEPLPKTMTIGHKTIVVTPVDEPDSPPRYPR
jgi:hypothetical protein